MESTSYTDITKSYSPSAKEPVVVIRDLHKSFEDNAVLKGIDPDLYPGENLVVLGKSGSGKSVLIKIIAGLLQPDQGIVRVLGQNIDQLKGKELLQLRLKIGFLFQANALYDSMTVRENLEFTYTRNNKHAPSKK